jgi:hypothetical protein
VKESEDGQTLLRRLVLVHRVADEADVSSCATLLNGPVSDLEGALRRLSAEEIEQWFDLELELAIRSQKNKMTTMKTNAVRILACSWLALPRAALGASLPASGRTRRSVGYSFRHAVGSSDQFVIPDCPTMNKESSISLLCSNPGVDLHDGWKDKLSSSGFGQTTSSRA